MKPLQHAIKELYDSGFSYIYAQSELYASHGTKYGISTIITELNRVYSKEA